MKFEYKLHALYTSQFLPSVNQKCHPRSRKLRPSQPLPRSQPRRSRPTSESTFQESRRRLTVKSVSASRLSRLSTEWSPTSLKISVPSSENSRERPRALLFLQRTSRLLSSWSVKMVSWPSTVLKKEVMLLWSSRKSKFN